MLSQKNPFHSVGSSVYRHFSRAQWCSLRQGAPLTLTETEVEELRGRNEVVSLQEVTEIYLPLSRLLSLYVIARQGLYCATGEFLGSEVPKVPYIIGVAGSVAVGKSTTSRVLKALLSRWPSHPKVEIITTDGFLYPNAELEERGIMHRKGFPESYNVQKLIDALSRIKAGESAVSVPVYSHHEYDIVTDESLVVDQPDIIIVEGLNILQTNLEQAAVERLPVFVSDFFDFSLFVDAKPEVIRQWYIERVLTLWEGPFQAPDSYFHHLSQLRHEEVVKFGERIWREINEINLHENILPYKGRAQLILRKGADHMVQEVSLRKL
jgi:type I pantothenate kinase